MTYIIIAVVVVIFVLVVASINRKKNPSTQITSTKSEVSKADSFKQEVLMDSQIPQIIQRTIFQALESLYLIGTSKSFDVLTGRYKFLLSLLKNLEEASMDTNYSSNVKKSIYDYKSLYDRNPESYQLDFLKNPKNFDLIDFYCKSLHSSFFKNLEEQTDQIKNLKRKDAVIKRKEKIKELFDKIKNEIVSECSNSSSYSDIIQDLENEESLFISLEGNVNQDPINATTRPKTKEEADAINKSYRKQDMVKYRNEDTILGFEIKRSNAADYNCEICKAGEGKYPKDFHWEGWHDGCKCHTVPVILRNDEFDKWVAGSGSKSFLTRRYVKDIPQSLKFFVLQNHDLISYNDWFVRNNKFFK
jgi:hypothetical protein